MKIVDYRVYVVALKPRREWVFLELETDDGIVGVGESTDYASTDLVVRGLEAVKPWVIGMDPRNIEDLWQRMFHRLSNINGRGYVSHLMSAIDIALWDIRGKMLGVPVYQLLGGRLHENIPLYTHAPGAEGGAMARTNVTPELSVEVALKAKEAGFRAIKTDPFVRQWKGAQPTGGDVVESLSPAAAARGAEWMMALREALGPEFELLVDAHARFDVASAIRMARALEPVNLVWLEEPVPVESMQALRQVRESTDVPLCIGERHFTRWDYVEIFNEQLVDFVMPDGAWTGGISELRRIAAMAEPHYIRFSPHDAQGPVMLMASAQVDMATPNLYRQECVHEFFPWYEQIVKEMFVVREGAIWLDDAKPGIGIELDHEKMRPHLVSQSA